MGKQMDQHEKQYAEKLQKKKNLEEFNSITNKVKPENQNQKHNVREEGVLPHDWNR